MKVKELIEKLQEMDQEAWVNVYGGYDPECGDLWIGSPNVVQENVGWDDYNNCPVVEVFIK